MTDDAIFTVREPSQRNPRSSNPSVSAKIGETCIDGLYGPLALMICILGSCTVTLIPLHNGVINTEYWFFWNANSIFIETIRHM